MKELIIDATTDNLPQVQEFIERELELSDVSLKVIMAISIAVEEIYVNIAHYAYSPEIGKATIKCSVEGSLNQVVIKFLDNGKPFNPLDKKDADITLDSDEREIGGLGILMVKKSMDSLEYKYYDGMNVLTIKKNL